MNMTDEESKAEDALARVLAMAYGRARRDSKITELVARDEKLLRQFMFGETKKKGE